MCHVVRLVCVDADMQWSTKEECLIGCMRGYNDFKLSSEARNGHLYGAKIKVVCLASALEWRPKWSSLRGLRRSCIFIWVESSLNSKSKWPNKPSEFIFIYMHEQSKDGEAASNKHALYCFEEKLKRNPVCRLLINYSHPPQSPWKKMPLRWSNCSSCIMHSCLRGRGSNIEEDTLHKSSPRH